MNNLIEVLQEAHVAHELSRFQDECYQQTIEEEVTAVFEWIKKIKLKDVMTAQQNYWTD